MKPQVISFHYTLRDESGNVLDASNADSPIAFLEGSGTIIEGLETSLGQMNKGDKDKVVVEAAKAYGTYDKEMIRKINRSQLPVEEVKVGDQFQAGSERHSPIVRVIAVEGDEVTLDGNHPLAGQDLHFDVEIVDKRDATEEEVEHGHVHGPGGHHH